MGRGRGKPGGKPSNHRQGEMPKALGARERARKKKARSPNTLPPFPLRRAYTLPWAAHLHQDLVLDLAKALVSEVPVAAAAAPGGGGREAGPPGATHDRNRKGRVPAASLPNQAANLANRPGSRSNEAAACMEASREAAWGPGVVAALAMQATWAWATFMALRTSLCMSSWDDRDGMWKVSVPHGQRFGKQFLAGVEVWATQMLQHGQVELLGGASTIGRAPPPPPPLRPTPSPIAAEGAAAAAAAVPLLPPPPPLRPPSKFMATEGGAAAAGATTTAAYDFTSFLLPILASSPPAGSSGSRPLGAPAAASPAAAEGAFYRPIIEDRQQAAAAAEEGEEDSIAHPSSSSTRAVGESSSSSRAAKAASRQVPSAADLKGDGGPEEGLDGGLEEAGGGCSSGLDDSSDEEFYEDYEDDSEVLDSSGSEEEEEEGEEEEEEEEGESEDEDEVWGEESEGEEEETEGFPDSSPAPTATTASTYTPAPFAFGFDLTPGSGAAPQTPGTPKLGGSSGAAKAGGFGEGPYSGTDPYGTGASPYWGQGPSSISSTPLQGTSPAALPGSFFPAALGETKTLGTPSTPLAPGWGNGTASPSLASPMLGQARGGGVGGGRQVLGFAGGRLRVSLQLERQSMTDVEAELLARWYQERASGLLELSKLWLFENQIGDVGAAACASLFHPGLREVHLSHNIMTNKGLRALLSAVPAKREKGLRPLWLRCEWNVLNLEQLEGLIDEQADRGVKVHVPQVAKAPTGFGHDMKLDRRTSEGTHVQLPWICMQKQPPSESEVLQATRAAYRAAPQSRKAAPAAAASPAAAGSQPPVPASTKAPAAAAAAATPKPALMRATPPAAAAAVASVEAVQMEPQQHVGQYSRGPLLLFPDTSAMLSMLGANTDQPSPPLNLDLLQQLAESGRFGRSLAPEDQTFVVISDSVMKQLDGLKAVPDCRKPIRKFLKEGLESMGPAGYDFLTVLGAHEGEGLLLEAGGLGVAGSSSPFISSKGQKVDFKIVEVALYFMKEVLSGAGEQYSNGMPSPRASSAEAAAAAGGTQAEAAAEQQQQLLQHLPVMLLSNDNAQILAARAHGLPAYRLSSPGDLASQLQGLGRAPLTSSTLRALLAPQAVLGLGSAAGISLQQQFDKAVATLRWLTDGLASAAGVIDQVHATATSPEVEPGIALDKIRNLLSPQAASAVRQQSDDETGHAAAAAASTWGNMVGSVQQQLLEWEGLVRSHQAPSRVLQWAAKADAQ